MPDPRPRHAAVYCAGLLLLAAGVACPRALLAADDSPADKLQIDGGHVSGSTEILFNRIGGSGAQTMDGILVVETLNGGTTASDAFYMTSPLSAGPYEYFLFRGTDEPGEADNWYLRSSLLPGSAPPRVAGQATVAPAPPPGAEPVPLYRPEIPLYAQAKSLAQQLSLTEIGTYHRRRGEQRSWAEGAAWNGRSRGGNNAWLRLYHRDARLDWKGDVYSRFDGHLSGFQLGGNFYAAPSCRGTQELGLFVGSSRASGDVTGFARGFEHFGAGRNQLQSYYIGGYFTDYRINQSYLDIVTKIAYVELDSRSSRQIADRTYGPQLSASAEGGVTVPVGGRINLEPQLQLIANYTNLDAYWDGISHVEPDVTPELTARAGLRGYNRQGRNQYYLYGNLWHTLGGDDEIQFNNRLRLENDRSATWAEIGAGIVLLERESGSAFLNLSYQRSVDDLDWQGGSANLGFNWAW